MSVGVIIPAAGSGTRLGEPVPKAFVKLGDRTILEVCVAGVLDAGVADTVVVVVPADLVDDARRMVPEATVVAGGAHRSDSVRAGMDAVGVADVVLVHDAARPFTPPAVFGRVVDAVGAGHPAVVPGLPVADTLKEVVPGDTSGIEQVRATVDREPLRAIQTPQGFTRDALRAAHADDTGLATDDAGLAERVGIPVHVVSGDPLAFKITTPWDLRIARDIVAESARTSTPSAGRVPTAGRVAPESPSAGRVAPESPTAGRVASERSEDAYRDPSHPEAPT
ncbi:2-C-methyl-D-erythritol 4-phosphate cytidylyltransferase [Gordonia sp. LSe1-13]|uniref:2-C-methyl-D-erythritol 4-phosphate cytidylyltransferase n=1 Tax=Gordonia sesuvii TaxID=3116777 RepID=A0ABU7MJH1_9ACTN|nr:2-C-methyl-D-erythritol 4-phosphate cytidylyltransferase [Gordonia sp. LSe1-13]